MLLHELFNVRVPVRYGWDVQGPYAEYTFIVTNERGGEIPYTIYAERIELDPEHVDADLSNYDFDLRMAGEVWAVEFGNDKASDRYGVTNTGKASEVFGHVAAALRMFKQSRPNAAFFFTAKEPSVGGCMTLWLHALAAHVKCKTPSTQVVFVGTW